jgi:hypothetical protein
MPGGAQRCERDAIVRPLDVGVLQVRELQADFPGTVFGHRAKQGIRM